MRSARCVGLFFLFGSVGFAAEDGHRAAARELIAEIGGERTITAAFDGMSGLVENVWRQQGVPESLFPVLRSALQDWLREDVKWSDIEPKMVDLYVQHFAETELRDMLAFYRTPTGRKALSLLPQLVAEGAKIGEAYALEKQHLLAARVERAMARKQADEPKAAAENKAD